MNWPTLSKDIYRVEVSGWDVSQNFFVEKTVLSGSDWENRQIPLANRVAEGAVIFVRLLNPIGTTNTLPVAYQVKDIESTKRVGIRQVSLIQIHPRQSGRIRLGSGDEVGAQSAPMTIGEDASESTTRLPN